MKQPGLDVTVPTAGLGVHLTVAREVFDIDIGTNTDRPLARLLL
jgi:hypothetical protein